MKRCAFEVRGSRSEENDYVTISITPPQRKLCKLHRLTLAEIHALGPLPPSQSHSPCLRIPGVDAMECDGDVLGPVVDGVGDAIETEGSDMHSSIQHGKYYLYSFNIVVHEVRVYYNLQKPYRTFLNEEGKEGEREGEGGRGGGRGSHSNCQQ